MNTTDTRRPLDGQAVGLMLLLCLIWSLQQILLKATAQDFSPTLQLALRSGIAAVLVWLYMRFKGERLTLASGIWQPGLLVGVLFALEFVMVGQAVRYTTAGHVVVFLYSAPVFAALRWLWVALLWPFWDMGGKAMARLRCWVMHWRWAVRWPGG